MRRDCFRPAAVLLLVLGCRCVFVDESLVRAEPPQEAAAPRKRLNGNQVFQRLLKSTCWIHAVDFKTNEWFHSGTGWVVDAERRLVVTNAHVVGKTSDGRRDGFDVVRIYFPEYDDDGEPISDPKHYLDQKTPIRGTVIDRDEGRDLALLECDRLPPAIVALNLAERGPKPGDRVHTLGGMPAGSDGLWIYSSGQVRRVYRRMHGNQAVAKVVESQLPTNPGNSGGPIVDDYGDLVAVHEGASLAGLLVILHIDLSELRPFLDEAMPLVEPKTAEDYLHRGFRRHNAGRNDYAIADYTQALKLDPTLADALVNRGWVFCRKEDYRTAIKDFEAALKIDAENAGAYDGRGLCRRELGQLDQAIDDFTEAIRRDADNSSLYQRRANAFRMKGSHDEELKDRNRAIEKDGGATADYFVERAQTLRLLDRTAEGLPDLERAINLQPGKADWWFEWANALVLSGRPDQAVVACDFGLQRDANMPELHYTRAMALRKQKRYRESVASFQQAIRLDATRPHYFIYLGYSLEDLEDYDGAFAAYSQAIAVAPKAARGYAERARLLSDLGHEKEAEADRAKAKEFESAE